MTDEYYQALIKCGDRYRELLRNYIDDNDYWGWNNQKASSTDARNLNTFLTEFIVGCNNKMPLMKLNRWLGYIQGSLIQWEVTTVENERNWTRPLFRPLDFDDET
jgi:hypothetical protein